MAFPTQGVLDSFGSGLGSWSADPVNAGWALFGITSGEARADELNDKAGYYHVTTFGPDTEVYLTASRFDVATLGNLKGFYLYLRLNDPDTTSVSGYGFEFSLNTSSATTDYAVMYRYDFGSETFIDFVEPTNHAAGDSFGVEAVGGDFALYRKRSGTWTVLATFSEGSYTDPGYIGFRMLAADPLKLAADEFGGGTVGAGGGGGTPQLLAASIASASAVGAALRVGKPLSASIQGTSSVSAALRPTKTLAASISSTSTVAASLHTATAKLLAASISSASSVTASLRATKAMAASIASTSTIAANLRATKRLAASISSTSSLAASLAVPKRLAATIASSGTVGAALRVGKPLAASIASTSSLVARLTVGGAVAATGRVYQSLQMIRTRIGW